MVKTANGIFIEFITHSDSQKNRMQISHFDIYQNHLILSSRNVTSAFYFLSNLIITFLLSTKLITNN